MAQLTQMAKQVSALSEQQLEQLAQQLYNANSDAALTLMKSIGFEDMESILERREGVAV